MRQLVESARSGSIRAASRLISLLENDPAQLPELFAGMAAWPQPRVVIGFTGAPGVGKSTLVDALLASIRLKYPERMLGVIAVDPSSPFTGGAVLGDRIRMMDHATDDKIFIRSLASRGHLGGLTLGIKGAIRVMGLVGCDMVLIETVGVGQSEIEVAGVADMTVIAMAPGHGDGIQLLKAGLMEAGDIFVINKSDRPGADKLLAELTATLSLSGAMEHPVAPVASEEIGHQEDPGVIPETPQGKARVQDAAVFKVCAAARTGIDELVAGIEARAQRFAGPIMRRRQQAVHEEIRYAIMETARRRLTAALDQDDGGEKRIQSVLAGTSSVGKLAEELMKQALDQNRAR